MEALALLSQTTLAEFSLGMPPRTRLREGAGRQAWLVLLPCRDGYVGISPRQQDQWERFVELMGSPAWAEDPKFATTDSRLANWGELEPLLAEWTRERSKEDVYRQAQSVRVFCRATISSLMVTRLGARNASDQEPRMSSISTGR